jgi:hypothetical protein
MSAGTSTLYGATSLVPLGSWQYLPGGYDSNSETALVLRAEVR